MILLIKAKTRAKRPGLFLTKKCYPQKNVIRLLPPSGRTKRISVLRTAKIQRFNATLSPY